MKEILEPLKEYSAYEQQFGDAVTRTFDELVAASKIDVQQNRLTAEKYEHAAAECNNEKKKLKGLRGWRGFLTFVSVASGVAAIIGGLITYAAVSEGQSLLTGILTLVISVLALIAAVLGIKLGLSGRIKQSKALLHALQQNADAILAEAWRQMQPLNELFDEEVTNKLVNDLGTVIHLDKYYSVLHEVYLNKYYDYPYFSDDDNSTINMVVGTINKNPFVISRELETEMGTKTYEGSLLVSWTETRRDSKGNTYTVTQTQTLIATVTKPCPYYGTDTFLAYCNEAAPNLNFTRQPQAFGKDDKEIARMVRRGEKKLARIADEDAKHGDGSFVAMSDTEFDVLFGAFDRDNENQFRLLFTPLAQRNMVSLIKDSPYGDDFYFHKMGKLNMVLSRHAEGWQMLTSRQMCSYSVDIAKQMFVEYNSQFFKNLYFMLAPLLNIPIYQQHRPNDFDIDLSAETNIAARTAEMVANALPQRFLAAEGSVTDIICKVKYISRSDKVDNIAIYAHSYGVIQRTDFVPRIAGNGRTYAVPVCWDEYVPLMKITEALIFDANGLSSEKYAELIDLLKHYDNVVGEEDSSIAQCLGVIVVIPQQNWTKELMNKVNDILRTKSA